jgi:hypothetical protein
MTYYLDDQDYNLDYDASDDEPPPAALPLTPRSEARWPGP